MSIPEIGVIFMPYIEVEPAAADTIYAMANCSSYVEAGK
jgi:hypothetical protein